MSDISTSYMGLKLKSPVIASSSGLTNNVSDIIALEKNGAGAVVLKSLFEEEIIIEMEQEFNKMYSENYLYPESMGFYDNYEIEDILSKYLQLINECKAETGIPIIASIHCITAHNWPYFAKSIEAAGADGIELNISILPSDMNATSTFNEKVLFEIITEVQKEVSIPIAVKISPYFSNLGAIVKEISKTGVKGIVLFNRFYSPDIDLENIEIVAANKFSSPNEYILPLRWIAILSDRVHCDLCPSTGIHDSNALIKMILAGAPAVQIASTLYKNGFAQIKLMLNDLKGYMNKNDFETIEQMKGLLRQSNSINPAGYSRIQFMQHFANK